MPEIRLDAGLELEEEVVTSQKEIFQERGQKDGALWGRMEIESWIMEEGDFEEETMSSQTDNVR